MFQLNNPFRVPSVPELIAREMAEAQRAKLEAESARDYAVAIVKYNDMRIARLQTYATSTPTNEN